jgi:hypothetical protein
LEEFPPMTPENLQRIVARAEKVLKSLGAARGVESYDEGLALLREQFRDKTASPAAYLHKLVPQIYPMTEPDTVRPELFYEILGEIDTREKAIAKLVLLPDSSVPELERFLEFCVKELLPGMRSSAAQVVKYYPYHRGGGRPLKMPGEADCRKICIHIRELLADGVLLGGAQKRIGKRWGKKTRMIDEIWRRWKDK